MTLGFISGLARTVAPVSVSVAHPRVCISKNIAGVPVANRSFNGTRATTVRAVCIPTPPGENPTGLQSPINVPNNGTVSVPVVNAPVVKEGTHVTTKSKQPENSKNLEMEVEKGEHGSFPGTVSFNGITYELVQLHVHNTSENVLDKRSFPIEMHLVHQEPTTKDVLVLAIFFDKGAHNAEFEKVLDAFQTPGTEATINVKAMLGAAVNRNQFLTFEGSRTTTPFDSGFQWVVSKEIAHIEEKQVARYMDTPHIVTPNNRCLQDVQDRPITAYF